MISLNPSDSEKLDREYWRKTISDARKGSLRPAVIRNSTLRSSKGALTAPPTVLQFAKRIHAKTVTRLPLDAGCQINLRPGMSINFEAGALVGNLHEDWIISDSKPPHGPFGRFSYIGPTGAPQTISRWPDLS